MPTPGPKSPDSANFGFLAAHDVTLVRLGAFAEFYATQDPNTAVFKVRQLAEALLQRVAAALGVESGPQIGQKALLDELSARGMLAREVLDHFHYLRRLGNDAAHAFRDSTSDAVHALKLARALAIWFHTTFGDATFRPGPFVAPRAPADPTAALRTQLDELRAQLDAERDRALAAGQLAAEEAARRTQALDRAAATAGDRDAAMALAEEMESLLAEERARAAEALTALRASLATESEPQRAATIAATVERGRKAVGAMQLDESDTRKLIDAQLRESGWEADTEALRYALGARPAKGVHRAIAEWPTASGPADYALFAGLTVVGVVEAKRKAKHVRSAVEQARRYSEGYLVKGDEALAGGPWGAHRVPFLFATNGRSFLRQLVDESGIWFHDARRATNLPRALEGWYTPDGLLELLKQDVDAAEAALAALPVDPFLLRPYQREAVRAVERAIADGRREILLAMATGTGKTRTLLGLVYRLLRERRFRRVLFLVDRNALGDQALETFGTVHVDGVETLAGIYDVKGLADATIDGDTRLHVATVQAMVRRLQQAADGDVPVPVDTYDCVVVDECHRGYTLDRELSDAELTFRDETDYISKYRRVLDHFDAVKIGLTATPALHTTQIFGAPVYHYGYRQAVIEGFLVDHEPPVQITTELSRDGIQWRAGEEVKSYRPGEDQVDLFVTPDELAFDVDAFNRQVVTENFNRVVCDVIAAHVDPRGPAKTLVFCATDAHADMVVRLLTEELAARYEGVTHDMVRKITAGADDPSALLRRFKNEARPSIAVTVDLLTTGVDVPAIVNLVFLRRVRSRVLYEQMLGRGTRLHPDLYGPGEDKEVFRVYDAVRLYEALEPVTEMKPVVRTVAVSISQLVADLRTAPSDETRRLVHEELVAALRRRKRRLARADETIAALGDGAAADVIDRIAAMTPREAAEWLAARPALVELFDRHGLGETRYLVSGHGDRLVSVSHGYGGGMKPEEYLAAFEAYLRSHVNEIPALLVVTQRPRDLTRRDLLALRAALDAAGFPEKALDAAYRDTNQEAAASIVGYVRQRALGSPLVPYAERVSRAVSKIRRSRAWTPPQRQWLDRIAKQLVREIVVDREALDSGAFRADYGGFDRMNTLLGGDLPELLDTLHEALWQESA